MIEYRYLNEASKRGLEKILTLILFFLASIMFSTISPKVATAKCIEGNCVNGKGVYVYPLGEKYTGEFKNGRREGFGTMIFPNEDTYEGEFVQGEPNGLGKYRYSNGDTYVGQFKNGFRDGFGVYTFSNGSKYEGEFVDDNAKENNQEAPQADEAARALPSTKSRTQPEPDENSGNAHSAKDTPQAGQSTTAVEEKNSEQDIDVLTVHESAPEIVPPNKGESNEVSVKPMDTETLAPSKEAGNTGTDLPPGEEVKDTVPVPQRSQGGIKPVDSRHGAPGEGRHDTLSGQTKDKDAASPEANSDISVIINDSDSFIIPKGRFVALLIGIGKYKNFDSLPTAAGDAETLAKTLAGHYGFEVTTLTDENATRDNIMAELSRLRSTLSPQDNLLVYYSGHGHTEKIIQKTYWLAFDAEKTSSANWIISDEITTQIKLIPARHILLIADSCFSSTALKVPSDKPETKWPIRSQVNRLGRTILSGGSNEPVPGQAGDHSIFLESLVNGLLNSSEKVFTTEEFFTRYMKKDNPDDFGSIPAYGSIANAGDEGGDFVFVKVK